MHRGGGCCGGHHGSNSAKQNNHGGENKKSGSKVIEMVYDPVCGLHIEKSNAISRRIEGRKYYFCSAECANNFIEDSA
ncbi:YHS domain-containing protein [Halanaerobaculum tunisiense]